MLDHPVEKLGAACFLENIELFANPRVKPESYNLYKGLAAMSQTLEEVLQAQHRLERRLDSIARALGGR